MSKIRESIISNSEKKFINKCLEEHRRLDGRAFDEFRELKIEFSKDWGCCYVSLGKTRVLAQVSCEIQQPKSSRPSEGILNINVELTPMGAPHFEPARQSDLSVHLNRMLEKCIKDSKAVDLESFCIKVNEKVWALRVDVNVLNHEGNLVDCSSIAALSALAHFRRPDITSDGEDFIVHTYAERDPIATVLHHYPVCVSYAIFIKSDVILADPTLLEEGVADAHLTMVLNAYKELCGLHLGGSALMSPETVLQCTSKAAARANIIIEQIKEVLENDKENRMKTNRISFENSHQFNEGSVAKKDNLSAHLNMWNTIEKKKKRPSKKIQIDERQNQDGIIESIDEGSAVLIPCEENNTRVWTVSSEEDSDVEIITKPNDIKDTVELMDDGSEEEDVVVLDGNAKGARNKRKRIK